MCSAICSSKGYQDQSTKNDAIVGNRLYLVRRFPGPQIKQSLIVRLYLGRGQLEGKWIRLKLGPKNPSLVQIKAARWW